MTHSDWLWKRIFIWFCIIYHFHFAGIHGRHYEKCLTPDGRDGICAAKRYCREANQFLVACGGESNVCCPIQPTHRSAQSSPTHGGTTEVKTTKAPVRTDRPRQESPYDRNPPREVSGDQRPRKPIQTSGRPVDEVSNPKRNPQTEKYPPEPPYEDPRKSVDVYERPTTNRERPQSPRRPNSDQDPFQTSGRPIDEPSKSKSDLPESPYEDPRKSVDIYGRPATNRERPQSPGRPNSEHESKVYETRPVPDRPSGHRSTDVSEDTGRRSQHVPGPRKEIPSASRPSDFDEKKPSPPREVEYERGSKPRPQSARPSHHPPIDEIEPQVSPPRRQKPPRSLPPRVEPPVKFPNPRDLPQQLPQVPACGVKPYDLFIAGGETSDEHEWPWMTAIFRRHSGSKPKTFQCGGSLINTRYVLTAAHCFVVNNVILPASAYVVRLGSHSLSSGEEYAVSNLVLHNNHSGSEFFNDIALVRLSSEVYITDKIAPICLPFREMLHENFVGRMAVVAGWGDTSFRSDGTRVLKHVSVPIVSNEECAAAYRRVRGAVFLARGSDHVMCAGLMEGGKDACQGDSGGPLMLKTQDDHWTVVGIVSLGYKCAEPGYPGVYTRVTHYMSWIHANMKPY
ncbi:serine protease Hayan-like [Argiope bruennichi]|uniref:serine protease Hayan-like n=1 Tax=Argiope bruennichi TaxID=94029 RepID=UPI0024946282|nr:serine protease Hayan-like [Argiope bruennichi]